MVLLLAASLTAPYLSALEVQRAVQIWPRAPRSAYARLRDAARLNPLSDEADAIAASIALRFGDLARADHEFALVLGRTPGDAYATLERGAIASASGQRRLAVSLLARAVRLSPREPLGARSLGAPRAGGRVNLAELNRSILLKAQHLA